MLPRRVGSDSGLLLEAAGSEAIPGFCYAMGSSCSRKEEQLQDRYLLFRELGRGRYGRVRKARDKQTSENAAIKTVNHSNDSRILHALKREAELMRLLKPVKGVPNLLNVYESSNRTHLAMELCEGPELFERILREKNFSEHKTCLILKSLLKTLAECHDLNVCHRDVKPENVLLRFKDSDYDDLVLVDFGLGRKVLDKKSTMHSRVGTTMYMAPEVQDAEARYTFKCDVWSVGVIGYVLLSGRPPFRGKNEVATVRSVLNDELEFESKFDIWRCVSDEAKQLIKWLLEKREKDRPSALEALNHSFFRKFSTKETENLPNSIEALCRFATLSKLARITFSEVASRLTDAEIAKLKADFDAIDENGDHMISPNELNRAMQKLNASVSDRELESLFEKLDLDGNRLLDLDEFVRAAVVHRQYLSPERVDLVFNLFDPDRQGRVSVAKMQALIEDVDSDSEDDLGVFAVASFDDSIEKLDFRNSIFHAVSSSEVLTATVT